MSSTLPPLVSICLNLSREEGPPDSAEAIKASVTSFDRRQANTKYYVSSFLYLACVCACVCGRRGRMEEGGKEGKGERIGRGKGEEGGEWEGGGG